jgi:hypothetical protein
MIYDYETQFCTATALSTAATGLAVVGVLVDTGTAGRDLGVGEPDMYAYFSVSTAVTSAGAATVQFILASDAQDPIAVDGSATVHATSAAIPKATLVAGYKFALALTVGVTAERYLGILQNVGTAALTAGAINAYLTADVPTYKSYPSGVL